VAGKAKHGKYFTLNALLHSHTAIPWLGRHKGLHFAKVAYIEYFLAVFETSSFTIHHYGALSQ